MAMTMTMTKKILAVLAGIKEVKDVTFPTFMQEVIDTKGLINYIKKDVK